MRLTAVLLRWYKSFNISYRSENAPRVEAQKRPWNALDVGAILANDYPFIEIPLEDDISTIVGGNESGKSHLISAISKVLRGLGVHDEKFDQTDLCRYATVPKQNPDRWPNIGLHIKVESPDESTRIKQALPSAPLPADQLREFALIVGSCEKDVAAHVFFNRGEAAFSIDEKQLTALREQLPRVRFLDAEAALPDNLTFKELLTACDPETNATPSRFGSAVAQAAAEFLAQAKPDTEGKLTAEDRVKLETIRSALVVNRVDVSADAEMAAKLFQEILDVTSGELAQVLDQPVERRGYTEYFLKQWNDRIFERLDLAHFWQQDDQATIELIYRDMALYFDITDKTGATYTFKERSSGLRYFLSYYIQAKALERRGRDRNAVILMDEPDSFLSILGQRNLLLVFESLVGGERSAGKAQLIYTTHSPFLINRNFPRRIRVVVKEEAEEGTQYYGRASSRRFEPVRSALGIDSAQTLFMGATNLVLEGLTDQYLINEIVRAVVKPETAHQFLDLNSVVVVSADGAPNIEKILDASQWGEEPVPATVVLVDGDEAGQRAIRDITGQTEGKKKLIEIEHCFAITPDLHMSLKGWTVETIEDLIPRRLYFDAFRRYISKWRPDIIDSKAAALNEALKRLVTAKEMGNVRAAAEISDTVGMESDLDKMGVLESVIQMVSESAVVGGDGDGRTPPRKETDEDIELLIERAKSLFARLDELIENSKQKAAQRSMAANVKRLIREFVRVRETGCSVIELRRHLDRLGREARVTHGIGEELATSVDYLGRQLESIERAGQGHLRGDEWMRWYRALDRIKRNPLAPSNIEAELRGGQPTENEAGEAETGEP
jgi:hypothetical protein